MSRRECPGLRDIHSGNHHSGKAELVQLEVAKEAAKPFEVRLSLSLSAKSNDEFAEVDYSHAMRNESK